MKLQLPEPTQLKLFKPSKYDVLVYGKTGTGKTRFSGSWADAGPLVYIDTDEGMTSLKGPETKQDNIFRVPIQNQSEDKHLPGPIGWPTVLGVVKLLNEEGVYPTQTHGDIKPKTLVVDSLTTASQYCLDWVLYTNKHVGQQPTQPDWGKLRNNLINMINYGRTMKNINFILVCHQQYLKDELSGQVWCLPNVVGKLAHEIGLYFDEVYHATVEQTAGKHNYVLETKATGLITASSNLNMPAKIQSHYNSLKGRIEELNK